MTNVQQAVKRVLDIIGEPTFENVERFLLEQYGCPIVYIGSEKCDKLDKLYSFGNYLKKDGFLTLRDKYYIFLSPKLNELDKLMVLYHELGHVECEHLKRETRLPRSIEEQEAEAFGYHLRCDAEDRKRLDLSDCIGVVPSPFIEALREQRGKHKNTTTVSL